MTTPVLTVIFLCVVAWVTTAQNTRPPCSQPPADCYSFSRTDCAAMDGSDDYCCGIGMFWETVRCNNGTSYDIKRFCCEQPCDHGGYCHNVMTMNEPCYNYYNSNNNIITDEVECWDHGCCWDADNPFGVECYQRNYYYDYYYHMLTCQDVYPECERQIPV